MEDVDRNELYFPEKNILEKGGAILLAVIDGIVVGTSALVGFPLSQRLPDCRHHLRSEQFNRFHGKLVWQ
jgi:hypothetical protein